MSAPTLGGNERSFPSTLPSILRMGSVMSVGFEKVYLLQNSLNQPASEIISTYVYKMGLISNQYSLSAAINLFNNVINFVLLLGDELALRQAEQDLFDLTKGEILYG